jgi:HlyD family secretion protein
MWRLLTNRRVLQGGAVVAVLLAVAVWPRTIDVETAAVTRGPLVVSIDEEGETRVHHRFVVAAPVAGRIGRIDLEPGDVVTGGVTVIARMRAEPPPLLDARSRVEAAAAVETARGQLGRARAEEQRARSAATLATADLAREQHLAEAGLTTTQAVQTREAAVLAADENLNAAAYAVAAAAAELERARARVSPPTLAASGRELEIRAPVDGVVLRRHRESEGVVTAGERLVEIGDPRHLEIVADLLSSDAVKVKPGMRVSIEDWGGAQPIAARVTRVEPGGFTKVSALGVEEQRVNVIMDVDDDEAAWTALGDGYRVEVRIAVQEIAEALQVPAAALFRVGAQWAAFVVDGGRARQVTISPGARASTMVDVRDGLAEGQRVVLHPPDSLVDGARVREALAR